MQEDFYDEFQLAKRHRIGYQAFFLTIGLILVNGFIKMNYIWAEPMIETLVLLYIPVTYSTVMMILKGAYTSKKARNTYLYIPMFGIVALFGLFVIVQSLWSGVFVFVEDGKLANSAALLFQTTFFTLVAVTMIIRRAIDFRMMRSEG